MKETCLSTFEVTLHNFSISHLTLKYAQAAKISVKKNKPVHRVPHWQAGVTVTPTRPSCSQTPSRQPPLPELRVGAGNVSRLLRQCLGPRWVWAQQSAPQARGRPHPLTPSPLFCRSEAAFRVSLPASPPSELLLFPSSLQSLSSSSPGDFRDCLEDF